MTISLYFEKNIEFPALLIDSVKIYSLEEEGEDIGLLDKIDAGAMWSAIPDKVVTKLGLTKARHIEAHDFDSVVRVKPSYFTRLEIEGLTRSSK